MSGTVPQQDSAYPSRYNAYPSLGDTAPLTMVGTPGNRFFLLTGSSHLLLAYEQWLETVFLLMYNTGRW